MDPFYLAVSLYRRRKYNKCIEICNQLLETKIQQFNENQISVLKMRAMTQRVFVDDIEAEDEITGRMLA